MSRLKTFESFEPLYRQITTTQAKKSFQSRGGFGEISKSELDQVSSFFKSIDGLVKDINDKQLVFIYPVPARQVVITKGNDDWFYVMDDFGHSLGTWYECDGLEGLMKCLEDL
jgi:hypothetical protein